MNKTNGRKIYVIFTADICMTGGMQCWVAGKAKSLEQLGWEVHIFFSSIGKKKKAIISSLDKYVGGRVVELHHTPTFYPRIIQERIIKKLLQSIGETTPEDTIYIESQDENAMWAEIIASRLKGKHFFFICNEKFRKPYHNYEDHMDFYDFKHRRREMAGEVDDQMQRFFDGIKVVNPEESYIFLLDEDPIQETDNDKVNQLTREDWNICYIGRAMKEYVPNIYSGVAAFSKKHSEKKIQFIILGDAKDRKPLIDNTLKGIDNLTITELGNVVPIPKSLFPKVDVVIAGSGSARCAAYEGTPTILASPVSRLSSGLLGYDTKDFLDCEQGVIADTFDNQLERVLVDKVQEKMKFDFVTKNDPMACTLQNLRLFEDSEQSLEYFPEEVLRQGKYINYIEIFKLYFKDAIKTFSYYLKTITPKR